jgi:hypothetical protein
MTRGDAFFIFIIFLSFVLFSGTPDLHDAIIEWVRSCK